MKALILYLSIALISSSIPVLIYGQSSNGKVLGKIVDGTGEAIEAATVSLFVEKDTMLVKAEMTDVNGAFLFESIPFGAYKIVVVYLGRKSYSSNVFLIGQLSPVITLPTIALPGKAIELKAVGVTGRKAFIEQKIDRTVVNVDALISNAGTTAFNVLEKSPGVRVDQGGGISLKGQQGVMIFINNKPTYLSGPQLEGYLRSLPASSLDQIEIMTNPPAKYEAAGNGGIINIKTKKQTAKGFNGGINLSYGQNRYSKTSNSANFNVRYNKLNFFANLTYGTRNSFNDISINRRYLNSDGSTNAYFLQHSYVRTPGSSVGASVGVDFYQSDKTTLGISMNGALRYPESRNQNTSNLLDAHSHLDSFIIASNKESGTFKNGDINLNYRRLFNKEGQELTVDLDYITYHMDNNQLMDNNSYLPDGRLQTKDQLSGQLPSKVMIYSAKTDYTQSLGKDYKFAVGLKSSYTNTDNIANYFYAINGISAPDYDKTNHFKYSENINAVYLNLNKNYKRLSVQAGLRFENTAADGYQLGNAVKSDSSFKRNYTSLFPTIFFLYKLDSALNNQLKLNFGRRIDRPYYQSLNPFISPLDKFTYRVGNPFLKPSFSQKIELAYIFKNWLTASLAYNNITDQVNETIEINDGVYYSKPGNIGKTIIKGISVDISRTPAKWCSFQVYGELSNIYSRSQFYSGLVDTKSTYVYTQGVLQFRMNKGWAAQLDGYYQSEITTVQFTIAGRGRLNAGILKNLSPKANVKLSVNDIFYTNISEGSINNLRLTSAGFKTLADSRWVLLSFSYRFGKALEGQRKHDAKGADAEKNRVQQ
jgi:hypothetical protein